jgi:hypothetical protein
MIDPLNLGRISNLMTPQTMEKYRKSWLEFVLFAGLTIYIMPNEDMYYSFFEKKREEDKLCGSTLWTIYQHLNKITHHLYGFRLQVSV